MEKSTSADEARKKIRRYCAYQERSHREVREKLFSLGLYARDVDEIVSELITEGFLNEERFARAFAGGKFRIKKWGRLKIIQGLEMKGVSPNCIRLGLQEIENDDYLATLRDLLTKYDDKLTDDNLYMRRDRLYKYAVQKGYEAELVWEVIRDLVKG